MALRSFSLEDVTWAAPLAEEAFEDVEPGYGRAVSSWALDVQVQGWVLKRKGARGFLLLGRTGLVGEGRPGILEVLAIVVEPRARRQGLARTLLSRAMQEARTDEGAWEIRCTVGAHNEGALALFAQAGFQVDRTDDGTLASGHRAMRLVWKPHDNRRKSPP